MNGEMDSGRSTLPATQTKKWIEEGEKLKE
jgi:hypothetical protein